MTRSSAKSSPTQSWFSKIKDTVLFAGGIVGMVFEAGFVVEPRTILIGAYLLAMGLPVFNGVDRLFQRSPATPPEDGDQQA